VPSLTCTTATRACAWWRAWGARSDISKLDSPFRLFRTASPASQRGRIGLLWDDREVLHRGPMRGTNCALRVMLRRSTMHKVVARMARSYECGQILAFRRHHSTRARKRTHFRPHAGAAWLTSRGNVVPKMPGLRRRDRSVHTQAASAHGAEDSDKADLPGAAPCRCQLSMKRAPLRGST
jgi:hypothetical protein